MAEFDHVCKIVARESGQALARVGGLSCRKWKPSESTLQATTERLADRVFEASQGNEHFIVYFEFVTKWDESVPWSVLGKSGMPAERERLPVVSLVFILRPSGYSPQNGRIRLTANGNPAQQVWFHERPLWTIEPEPWWEQEPGLMALYPLCKHAERPDESVLYAASRIEDNEKDRAVRADLLTSLGIFGRLAYPGLDALSLIGREKMKESLAYQEILQEGETKGETKASRVHILAVIADRFGKKAANAFRGSLKAIDDPKRLDRLFQTALHCSELDDLRKAVDAP